MSDKLFGCGHLRHGAPVREWPDMCVFCEEDAETEYRSQLWATVRTLAVFVVMVLGLMMTCAGPR